MLQACGLYTAQLWCLITMLVISPVNQPEGNRFKRMDRKACTVEHRGRVTRHRQNNYLDHQMRDGRDDDDVDAYTKDVVMVNMKQHHLTLHMTWLWSLQMPCRTESSKLSAK